jgi:hypothetical protein
MVVNGYERLRMVIPNNIKRIYNESKMTIKAKLFAALFTFSIGIACGMFIYAKYIEEPCSGVTIKKMKAKKGSTIDSNIMLEHER